MDLWTELQKVRKQFSDLKDQTEHDLDQQKSDFNRVVRNITNVTHTIGGGGTYAVRQLVKLNEYQVLVGWRSF